MALHLVPVIDLGGPGRLGPPDRPGQQDCGFLTVAGHGVEPALIDAMRAMTEEFFALSLDEKLGWRQPQPRDRPG